MPTVILLRKVAERTAPARSAKPYYRPAAISCRPLLRLLLLGLQRRCKAAEQSYTDPYSWRDWMETLARRHAVMEQRMLGKRL